MVEFFLVCPKCKKMEKLCEDHETDWEEDYKEYTTYTIKGNAIMPKKDDLTFVSYQFSELCHSEHIQTRHICGFYTHSWTANDFHVCIDHNRIISMGCYWEEHPDELQKILQTQKQEN